MIIPSLHPIIPTVDWRINRHRLDEELLPSFADDQKSSQTAGFSPVVVVVNILFQTKKTTLMIGHCTALAVFVTKTLAGKISELKQEKDESLLHLMSWCVKKLQAANLLHPPITTNDGPLVMGKKKAAEQEEVSEEEVSEEEVSEEVAEMKKKKKKSEEAGEEPEKKKKKKKQSEEKDEQEEDQQEVSQNKGKKRPADADAEDNASHRYSPRNAPTLTRCSQ